MKLGLRIVLLLLWSVLTVESKTANWDHIFSATTSLTRTLEPDGISTTTNEYYLTGLLRHSSGFGRYPSSYTYDGVGRRTFMTNWSSFPSTGARVTQWQYNDQGRLQKKIAAGTTNETSYAYSPGGRVQTVAFPDAVERSQNYNEAGRISAIYFSTNTPGMTNRYNRLGQVDAVQQGETTTSYSLDFLGNMMSETFSGGTLNGIALSRGLDHFLRVTNISVNSTPSASQAYAYDAASRLQSASMLGHSANYSYETASGLIKRVDYQKANVTRFTEGRGFDEFLRLNQLNYTNWAGKHILPQRDNGFNILSQITSVSFDGKNSTIGYDPLGQISGMTNKWADDTSPVAGQRWNYSFDDIGNRALVQSGGDENGNNLRDTAYLPTMANQYSHVTNSGATPLIGEADPGTLAINSSTSGITRHESYFHKELTADVSGGGVHLPVKLTLTNGTSYADSIEGLAYLPPENEELTYSPRGQLLTDGRWTYTWDAWDRLTILDRRNPSEPVERIEFEYDHLGRRIKKSVTLTNASVVSTKFIHDGWKLIAELDTSFNLVRPYLWGADLSQTRDGAAGVGGLVGINIETNGFYFAASDGRGNVTGLIKPTVSTPSVQYDYSPFGETIRASGELADANPLRYSTKYFDDETGLIYFGHRYYHPAQGRWANPDPLEELGGVNLYGFLNNNPLNSYDPQGLEIRRTDSSTILGGIPAPTGPFAYYYGDTFLEDINSQIANVPALALNSIHAAGQGLMTLAGYLGDGLTELENNTVGPNGLNAMGPAGAPATGTIIGLKGLGKIGKLAKVTKCPPGAKRTPAENRTARNFFKNNKEKARQAWEQQTGKEWPKDANGNPWPAEHTPSLKSGGDPMTVTPRDPALPDPHNIPGPDGLTDYQRWGALGTTAREGK